MPRVEIDVKRGRTVAVLFPEHVVYSLDLLLLTRNKFANKENQYLFPSVYYGSLSHIRGSDCMRSLAAECGAKAPERLTSTNLRKHIATMSQVMNLKENELDILANFMGHDIRVHREFYRLPEATVQVAKVAKLLMTMENGGTDLRAGQSLDDIHLEDEIISQDDPHDQEDYDSSGSDIDDHSTEKSKSDTELTNNSRNEQEIQPEADSVKKRTSYVRRPWSEGEKSAVKNFFDRHLLISNKLPGKKGCEACIKANPVLKLRSWRNIKDYCYNTFKKK